MNLNKIKERQKQIVIVVVILIFIITAMSLLNKRGSVIDISHTLPMVAFEEKDKLWQVVTYDDEPVTAMTIEVYPKYSERFRKVYINYRSQFVFSDGSSVTLNNEPLFWNRHGDIVDYDYNVIPEGMIFYIDGKGMKHRTAMTLKTLKTDLRSGVLKAKDKQREKQFNQMIEGR